MRALIALLVLVAGCSAASEARPEPARRVVATSTTTTTIRVPVTRERPTDEVGLRCQAAVDAVTKELLDAGKAPVGVDGVCRTRDQDALLGSRAGYSVGLLFVVRYPFDRVPEPLWEQAWRDVTAHEIGHTWSRRFDAAQQQSYAAIRGQAGWNSEDYADVFAAVIGGVGPGALTYIGSPPPAEQVDALCAERLLPC